jgi:L-asparaginase
MGFLFLYWCIEMMNFVISEKFSDKLICRHFSIYQRIAESLNLIEKAHRFGYMHINMKIKIYTTGGTIDKVYFDRKSDYQVGDPQAKGVLERANVVLDYEVESIIRKDSLDFTDEDRELIRKTVESTPLERVVITHGTDTMIDTAKVLNNIPGKTIVMTGSMYPAQFRDSDAVFNIGCAITAAQILLPGVYIVMNGRIFEPHHVRKNVELNRFEAKTM